MGAGNHASYDFSHIGENIAALRRAAGMTQEMLAFRLGVSSQAVSKWERQLSFPDLSLLPVIAEVFGVSIDTLFLGGQSGEGLLPVDSLFMDCPSCTADGFMERRLRCGNPVKCAEKDGKYRIYSENGEFLLLGQVFGGELKTIKSFFEV